MKDQTDDAAEQLNNSAHDMQVDSKFKRKGKYSGLHGLRSPSWHYSNPELATPGTPTEDPTIITQSDLESVIETMLDPIKKELKNTKELCTKVNNDLLETKKQLAKEHQVNLLLKERLLKLDGFSRRYNLRFYGIQESNHESKFDCKRQILYMLQPAGIVIPQKGIENAHRVGPKKMHKNGKPRMIIAKFFHLRGKRTCPAKKRPYQMVVQYSYRRRLSP